MIPGLAAGLFFELALLALVNLVMIRLILKYPGAPFTRAVAGGMGVVIVFLLPAAAQTLRGGGWRELMPVINGAVQAAVDSASRPSGIDDADWKDLINGMKWFLTQALPALIAVLWLGWLVFNALLLRWLLKRLGRVASLAPALRWRAPWLLMWAVLVPGFFLLAGQWLPDASAIPWMGQAALNTLVLVLPVYLLQGVFVVQWTLGAWGLGPVGSLLAWMGVLLAIHSVSPALVLSLTMLGLLDMWFDFRARKKRSEP